MPHLNTDVPQVTEEIAHIQLVNVYWRSLPILRSI